jgi:DNA-binding NtrC family response regulator
LSATNAELPSEVEAGRFRQDLFFRLNTVEILLPPLRDRREDIPVLSAFFLERFTKKYRRTISGFSSDAESALLQHYWPGNIRELSHAVERAVLMARGERIEFGDLGLRGGAEATPRLEDLSLDEVERYLMRRTLDRNDGNAKLAADALGLSRSAFYRRLEKHGIKTQS